jgi:hypothetical protein
VSEGTNELVGIDPDRIVEAGLQAWAALEKEHPQLWDDGRERIAARGSDRRG